MGRFLQAWTVGHDLMPASDRSGKKTPVDEISKLSASGTA